MIQKYLKSLTGLDGRRSPLRHGGFGLVELIVGVSVFLIVSLSAYEAFTSTFSLISASRSKIVAMDLANEQFEIVRNLPYADVGIENSIPSGVLEHVQILERSGYTFIATTTVRNIDDPFDGTIGGEPNDLSPADNRLVEIEIGCPSCKNFQPVFVNTRIAPKNLETASTNGALFIEVLDGNGQPVPNASVTVTNSQGTSPVIINDVTNTSGMLQIVDAPPGVNAYEIVVTKSGYTTDRTYLPGVPTNPNPLRPHATVALQQVTQMSFVIDKISSMEVSSVTQTCTPVGNLDFSLSGTRLIGTNPNVLKYDRDHITSADGRKSIPNLEWDTYSLLSTDSGYDLMGTSPIFPVNLLPDSAQNVQLTVAPKNPRTLVVAIKDAATSLPLASSTAQLQGAGYDTTLVTGRGFITQTDWSKGGGQGTSTDPSKFYTSSKVETNDPAGELKLTGSFGVYDENGSLTSSTFDVGAATTSVYHQLFWLPVDQPPAAGDTSVQFQIATNNDTTTWNFLGPDGTAGTFYTVADSNIHPTHNGDQFIRYKVYLSTENTAFTPNISDISFTFTSDCVSPGQVAFTGLDLGTYTLTVSFPGYATYVGTVNIDSSWRQVEVSLSPQ